MHLQDQDVAGLGGGDAALSGGRQASSVAIHAELQEALSAAATAHRRGRGPDTVVEARLLLAVADGLMFDAGQRPRHADPAELEAALDAYLDRLLPTGDNQAATAPARRPESR
jgi:BetI-type transcriptional repressor, C-terminal